MKHFTYTAFNDIDRLVRLKQKKGLTVGLALPVLNEKKTVGKIIRCIQAYPKLVDRFAIFDSGSVDGSKALCRKLGARIIPDTRVAAEQGVPVIHGKGFNLWASLRYLPTDIVAWIDSDTRNMGKRFISGLIGPLITDDRLQFIKGYYQRSKRDARVTEILVRPYISQIFPELNDFIQPLSGEYAGRRKFLKQLTFFSGYSVDIALLLQARLLLSDPELAQVYLGTRFHKLQSVAALGKMGASILYTLLYYSRKSGRLSFCSSKPLPVLSRFVTRDGRTYFCERIPIRDRMLPPRSRITHEITSR